MKKNIEADKLKEIFSTNLKRLMVASDKRTADIATDLNIAYATVSDWVNGKNYPRMDKVQLLADYFSVLKSNLTEESGGGHIPKTVHFQNGKIFTYDDLPDEAQKEVDSFLQYVRQKYSDQN